MQKRKKVTLKEILKKNPHIKASDLQKYEELKKDLQKLGFTSKGYQLARPYEKRYFVDDDLDSRTVDLSSADY
jgi:hypothetical protein